MIKNHPVTIHLNFRFDSKMGSFDCVKGIKSLGHFLVLIINITDIVSDWVVYHEISTFTIYNSTEATISNATNEKTTQTITGDGSVPRDNSINLATKFFLSAAIASSILILVEAYKAFYRINENSNFFCCDLEAKSDHYKDRRELIFIILSLATAIVEDILVLVIVAKRANDGTHLLLFITDPKAGDSFFFKVLMCVVKSPIVAFVPLYKTIDCFEDEGCCCKCEPIKTKGWKEGFYYFLVLLSIFAAVTMVFMAFLNLDRMDKSVFDFCC